MTLGARLWVCRYAAEDRRRLAAARQHYFTVAMWCLLLVVLGAGRHP